MPNILEQMLFPEGIKCIICDDELPNFSETGLCERCRIDCKKSHCPHCGREFYSRSNDMFSGARLSFSNRLLRRRLKKQQAIGDDSEVDTKSEDLCAECQIDPMYFTKAASPYVYLGNIKSLIYRLKYGNGAYLSKYLAKHMAKTFNQQDWEVDFITFSPMSAKRLGERGYNQAELLAVELGKLIGIKTTGILDKVKETKRLTRLNKQQRMQKIKGSILLMDGVKLTGQRVLFVDDVLTTAATANECCKVLIDGGASKVFVLTVATSRTLPKISKKS